MSFLGDFINGEFVKPLQTNGKIERKNPANMKELVFEGGFKFEHIGEACSVAKKSFRSWADLSLESRKEHLQKLKEGCVQRSEDLARLICKETGKPLWEAKQEVQEAIYKIDLTLHEDLKLVQSQNRTGAFGELPGVLRFKPRGVMAVIGAFDSPLKYSFGHIFPALATGNTVVFKPSELTPGTGQLLAEIFEKAALPKGVLNMIQGSGEMGRRLVMHEFVEGILFTGSYETGFKIKQDILTHFWKICALEMGGKNASIVWDDCHLPKAIYEILVGSFITTGQRCLSTSRIIVRKSIYEKFIHAFHNSAKKLIIDDPMKNPFMGPLVSAESQDKFLRFQSIASRENTETIMRGKALELEGEGYFVTPSINLVRKLDPESIFQKTEILGPSVAIYVVEELDEAIQIVNSSSFGLALSVFSKDSKVFDRCFKFSRMGLVNWNISTVAMSERLPFGGMGKSGNGNPAGSFSVFTSTYPVSILEDQSKFNFNQILPGMNLNEKDFI